MMNNYELEDEEDPAKWTASGLLHGGSIHKSNRKWQVNTKLTRDEILLWKSLSQRHKKPMNAVAVMAFRLLEQQSPR